MEAGYVSTLLDILIAASKVVLAVPIALGMMLVAGWVIEHGCNWLERKLP